MDGYMDFIQNICAAIRYARIPAEENSPAEEIPGNIKNTEAHTEDSIAADNLPVSQHNC